MDTPDHDPARRSRHRQDLHNSEVDEALAEQQLCGTTHLNSGHVCRLPERHSGGCVFTGPAATG